MASARLAGPQLTAMERTQRVVGRRSLLLRTRPSLVLLGHTRLALQQTVLEVMRRWTTGRAALMLLTGLQGR